jgi:hypothetical protein
MPVMKRIPSSGYQKNDAKEQDKATSVNVAERQARQASP